MALEINGVPVLTAANYESLKLAQRRLHDVLPALDAADACGVECQLLRQMHGLVSEQLARLESTFLTPPPRP